MSEYCCPTPNNSVPSYPHPRICPQDGTLGCPVALITLKSLLKAAALMQLDPQQTYRFCPSSNCSVVYFSADGKTFTIADLKVPVFQKDPGAEVPVCYCFGWTRQRIQHELVSAGQTTAIESITAHIKAKRCGCEVNNPQGNCCLGNVRQTAKQAMETLRGDLHDPPV